MKKLFVLMACLFAMVPMTGCMSNTPKDVATAYMKALKNLDPEDMVEVMGDRDGNAFPEEDIEGYKSMAESKIVNRYKACPIKSFKFVEEIVPEGSTYATVVFEVVRCDESKGPETIKVKLRKGDDGKWRVKA